MADIAGIIEGASQGAGLGFKFLKHIERTKVLIHVVDVSGSEGRNPSDDYRTIMSELEQYDPALLDKPMIVAANKMDIAQDQELLDEFMKLMEEEGRKVFPISAATGEGIDALLNEALLAVENYVEPETDPFMMYDFSADEEDPDYRNIYAYYDDEEDVFVLEGKQLTKIFNSTNFNDAGSVRYLYRYIEKQGGMKQLFNLGLSDGDTVRIEDFEFEYIPED